jgi:hypothetical protein
MTDREILEHIAENGCYLISCNGNITGGEQINENSPCPFTNEKLAPCHTEIKVQINVERAADSDFIKKQAQDRLDELDKLKHIEELK